MNVLNEMVRQKCMIRKEDIKDNLRVVLIEDKIRKYFFWPHIKD